MNKFFLTTFYHNTIKDWSISIGIIILSFVFAKALYWVSKNVFKKITLKTKTLIDDIIIDELDEPTIFSITVVGFFIALNRLNFPKEFKEGSENFFHFLITLAVTWFFVRMINKLLSFYLVPLVNKSENTLDDQLLPIIRKGLTIGTWSLGLVVGLNNAGVNVGALIAGMGIGGLAFAMAAKDTIANFFGGVTVFTDKPFKVKDRIVINGFDGTVAEIGLRSTRLSTLAGRVVTIPNSVFIDGIVENITVEPTRKIVTNLGLLYETTPEKMKQSLDILRSIVSEHKGTGETIHSHFIGYGDSSLNIVLIYYILKESDIFQTQTDINLAILEEFNKEGLGFAFPTTTLDLPSSLTLKS